MKQHLYERVKIRQQRGLVGIIRKDWAKSTNFVSKWSTKFENIIKKFHKSFNGKINLFSEHGGGLSQLDQEYIDISKIPFSTHLSGYMRLPVQKYLFKWLWPFRYNSWSILVTITCYLWTLPLHKHFSRVPFGFSLYYFCKTYINISRYPVMLLL